MLLRSRLATTLAPLIALALVGVAACRTREAPRVEVVAERTAGVAPATPLPTAAPPLADEAPPSCATFRDVVVSDLVRIDGTTMFYADGGEGLTLVDVSDAAHPRVLGVSAFRGSPSALFVRQGIAWVVYTDSDPKTAKNGPRTVIRGVDVRDPHAPRIAGELVRDGYALDAKLVGGFLYVLRGKSAHSTVESFGIRDGKVAAFDSIALDGKAAQLAASAAGLAVVTVIGDRSTVAWLDLSMERPGSLFLRDAVSVPGGVATWEHGEGRIIDADEGQRVRLVACATHACELSESATLHIVDFATEAPSKSVSSLQVTHHDGLPLTRFADGLLYVAETTPGGDDATTLHVVRTEDEAPTFLAHVTLRGRLSALVPHDGSLVALGTTGSPETQVKIVMHDLDVRKPSAPRERASVSFGSDWTWSVALRDDEALSFDPASNLVAVPFTAWRHLDKKYVTGAQIVDLAPRGAGNVASFPTEGSVERAVFLDGHLVTIGPDGVGSVDYASTHEPDLRERMLELGPRGTNVR